MIFTCNQLPAKADFYSYKIHANNLENDLLFHEMVEVIKLPFLGIMNVGTDVGQGVHFHKNGFAL